MARRDNHTMILGEASRSDEPDRISVCRAQRHHRLGAFCVANASVCGAGTYLTAESADVSLVCAAPEVRSEQTQRFVCMCVVCSSEVSPVCANALSSVYFAHLYYHALAHPRTIAHD